MGLLSGRHPEKRGRRRGGRWPTYHSYKSVKELLAQLQCLDSPAIQEIILNLDRRDLFPVWSKFNSKNNIITRCYTMPIDSDCQDDLVYANRTPNSKLTLPDSRVSLLSSSTSPRTCEQSQTILAIRVRCEVDSSVQRHHPTGRSIVSFPSRLFDSSSARFALLYSQCRKYFSGGIAEDNSSSEMFGVSKYLGLVSVDGSILKSRRSKHQGKIDWMHRRI